MQTELANCAVSGVCVVRTRKCRGKLAGVDAKKSGCKVKLRANADARARSIGAWRVKLRRSTVRQGKIEDADASKNCIHPFSATNQHSLSFHRPATTMINFPTNFSLR